MPRGEDPNSRANLKRAYNGRGGFDTETARKAKEKSDAAKLANRSLSETLRELCTDERKIKIIERLLIMAEHGNLKALQIILRYLGEDPEIEVKKAELELKRKEAERKNPERSDEPTIFEQMVRELYERPDSEAEAVSD